ncbi:MAG: M15 family metallopeptidase [Smithellaceae bacterium]
MTDEDIVIIDSDMGFADAVAGSTAPLEIIDRLGLIDVFYYSFDGKRHHGQIIADFALEDEIAEIFAEIEKLKFPLMQVIPIVEYQWDDYKSMAANNSSGFNFRVIEGTTKLSMHSLGRAVDINPAQNPVIYPDGRVVPEGAVYQPGKAGTVTADHPVVREFLKHGWHWGGNFEQPKDYHHFEKP